MYSFILVWLGGPPKELPKRPSNHRVNPIRGDEFSMSAEQVEDRLRQKLRENFEVRNWEGVS